MNSEFDLDESLEKEVKEALIEIMNNGTTDERLSAISLSIKLLEMKVL